MPPSQPQRYGFTDVTEAGTEWEVQKLAELREHLGAAALIGAGEIRHVPTGGRFEFQPSPLADGLPGAGPGQFLVLPEFEMENPGFPGGMSFPRLSGLHALTESHRLTFAKVIPDLIEVHPPGTFSSCVLPSGEVEHLPPGDGRLQLRVVDIKMTSEPGANYFTEVTWYTLALAGWLEDTKDAAGRPLSERFVAVPEAAISPGSHEASALVRLVRQARADGAEASTPDKLAAWRSELEETVFPVFRYRIDHFIRSVLPEVLAADWESLPFHVTPSCKNCEYLGYPWRKADGSPTWHEKHCWPQGEGGGGHLSRIPRMSRGAAEVLAGQGHGTVESLAALDAWDGALDGHQSLRAGRTVLVHRAAAFQGEQAGIAPDSGTSASMPKFVNLRILVTAAFDQSSALTLSLGVSGSFFAQMPDRPETRLTRRFPTEVFVADQRHLNSEFRALRDFLVRMSGIMRDAQIRAWENANRGRDRRGNPDSDQCRFQVYFWDQISYEHLCRVVGRHLNALLQNNELRSLAWLFPAEELLANPEHASRASAITIVENVVRASLAAPIPHHYALMGVARVYHPASIQNPEQMFRVHPVFEDKLSDQIPSERAVEIWHRKPGWETTMANLRETVLRQHMALGAVIQRLQADLPLARASMAAPLMSSVGPASIKDRMSLDGHLWLTFAKLNEAMAALEAEDIRAMPVHEREARGKSARLTRRLVGRDEADALAALDLPAMPGRRVYVLADSSADVAIRDGEMGVALAPVDEPGILDRSFFAVAERFGIPINADRGEGKWRMSQALSVTPVRIDRDRLLAVMDETRQRPGILELLERSGAVDLGAEVMLDPVHTDYFTSPLGKVLLKVGLPVEAVNDPIAVRATGHPPVVPRRRHTESSPLSKFLWRAREMTQAVLPPLSAPVLATLDAHGLGLNPSQRRAMLNSLGHRAHLVWGPPGTGKSHTLAVMLAAAVLRARLEGRCLRVLVTAFTWSAIDNLLPSMWENVEKVAPGQATFRRLASRGYPPVLPDDYPVPVEPLDRTDPSPAIQDLLDALGGAASGTVVVVGSTAGQVVNLLRAMRPPNGDNYAGKLFDLAIIDEGSQLDVAHAAMALAALADGASVVCAGDPKQMAPIHLAEPPKGLEAMVGSVYGFLRECHGVPETQLLLNYRSNAEVVDAFRPAGYGPDLAANAPALRVRLAPADGGGAQPADWPASLPWTPALDLLLDPDRPVGCVIHQDGMSAQSSMFEAQLTAALVWRLWTRIIPGLAGEVGFDGAPKPLRAAAAPDPVEFWGKTIGIVTPHRAQQGLVVGLLVRLFRPLGHDPDLIRKAVDTVERFQGQERDVMLASYAVGDPDTVGDEEEFLHSLNRFNVMVSRARAKLLVVFTEQLVGHLSNDIDVIRQSAMLKHFAESHCRHRAAVRLPWRRAGGAEDDKEASFRWA